MKAFDEAASAFRLDNGGQMTVELAVVLPVVIIVAAIAVNAFTFLGECAEFDRVSRNAVRVHAISPAYGQELDQSIAKVEAAIDEAMTLSNTTTSVTASQDASGHTTFEAMLTYEPTLFGLGLKSEVFGVPLPALHHTSTLVVDVYKPGMLF